MSRTVRLGGRLGGEVLLVEWSAVRRYRAGEAAEMLRDRCAAGSADADHLMALAASVGGFRGMPDTLEQAIELVAERIADGSITVVTLEPEYGGAAGRSQSSGVYGEPDWDDIRPLSDLRETDPTITFGALSIELVDHTGIPFRNQELKLRRGDGGIDRIVLDAQGKWNTRSIEKTGTCKLVLPARLELTPEQLADGGPDGFQLTAGDLTVRREQPGELSLPRYDVHYRIVVDPPARTGPQIGPRAVDLRVQIVLDDGAPVSGASITATAADGVPRSLEADDAGEILVANVEADAKTYVDLLPGRVPRWRGLDGFIASPHSAPLPFSSLVGFELPNEGTQIVVLERPVLHRIEGASLRFARNSSILAPLDPYRSPLAGLATAVAVLGERAELALLLVGHASADGDGGANSDLAGRRADGVRLLLEGDRDGWVALAARHGAPADIQRLLAYLFQIHDWPTDPQRTDGVVDTQFEQAVRAFQSTYDDIYDASIEVDGVCGEETLGAFFDCQSYELHEAVAVLGGSMARLRWFGGRSASASADVRNHPALSDSAAADGQRRVDLLLVPSELRWVESDEVSRLYDAARFMPVPIRELPVGRKDLVLDVVDHYGRPLVGIDYVVETDLERRVGTTDLGGKLVERGLEGTIARMTFDGVLLRAVDPAYESRCAPARTRADIPPQIESDWDIFGDEDEQA